MPHIKLVIPVLTLVLAAHPAVADQPTGAYTTQVCGYSDEPGAHQAMKLLTPGTLIQLFCLDCQNRQSTPIRIGTAELIPQDPTMSEIRINGETLDTAQTYVQAKPGGPWTNLGYLIKCSPDFVANKVGLRRAQPRTLVPAQLSREVPQAPQPESVARR